MEEKVKEVRKSFNRQLEYATRDVWLMRQIIPACFPHVDIKSLSDESIEQLINKLEDIERTLLNEQDKRN